MTVNELIEFCKKENLSLDTEIIVDVYLGYGEFIEEPCNVNDIKKFRDNIAIKLF